MKSTDVANRPADFLNEDKYFPPPRIDLKIKLAIHKVLIKKSANTMTDKITKTGKLFC